MFCAIFLSQNLLLFMKSFLRNLVLNELRRLCKRRLKKFRGTVIGVTGSAGKTTTKDAIFTVLNSQFRVKRTKKSMNSEFGLPLTILDIESGFGSAFKWSWLLMKAWVHSFAKEHSEVLLLEFGVDKPGDMDQLLSLVKPDIAVFTGVAPVHMEEGQFATLDEVFKEKRKLVDALKEKGIAVLNMDNEYSAGLAKELGKRKYLGYGIEEQADFQAINITSDEKGLSFDVAFDEQLLRVELPVIGKVNAYAVLAAIVCGKKMNMAMDQIVSALTRFSLPPGRMSLLPGISGIQIIDSSYNSSPASCEIALEVLAEVGGKHRKVAVLGSMNELGEKSELYHRKMGEKAAEVADLLITVGKEGKWIAEEAVNSGLSEDMVIITNISKEATEEYKKLIKEGDVVLVKGSQNRIRLERFVKDFMAHPEDAKDLLVRQERVWINKL